MLSTNKHCGFGQKGKTQQPQKINIKALAEAGN